MNAFIHHFAFEFRTGIRNKQLLLMNYLFPLGFYLMMGFIMPGINPPFRENLIPAMIVFGILAATLLGIPDPLVNARENGIFRSFKINGIPVSSILIIPALTTTLHLIIVTAVITFTAHWLFAAPLPMNWANFSIIFIATAFSCAGISVLIGVVSPSSRMTVLWSQLIFVPSMLLGGLMVPYNLLPDIAGKFAQLLPATQAMNAYNGLVMQKMADFSPWGSVSVLLIGGILAFGLAAYLFSWDSHNTRRRGNSLLALLVLLPNVLGILLFN
jgi:ABC-2 type transport system permease protein